MTGSIELATTEPGWLAIPVGTPERLRTAWITDRSAELQHAWGELWNPDVADRVRDMLRTALEDPPDAQFVFDVWPVFRTVRVQVEVGIFDPATLPDWRAEGFSVLAYEDAPIGPGIMCVRMHDLVDGGEVQASLVDWCAVFDDGTRAVVVRVGSTLPHLLGHILQGLHGMISTLKVSLSEGTPFQPAAPAAVLIDDDAIWMSLQLDSAHRADGESTIDDRSGQR